MKRSTGSFLLLVCSLIASVSAFAHERVATYLANEGVMVQSGDIKVVFDPLFDNVYGQYQPLPADMREALLTGKPPYNNLSAAFISHSHGDHFSPVDMTTLLLQHASLRLYAPTQAVEDLRQAENFTSEILDRVISIEPSDEPQMFTLGNIVIGAEAVPHAGWPNRMKDVHNLTFRVTLADTTVVHLGDADTKDFHFSPHAEYWAERDIHMAFPPYWYLFSKNGQQVLERLDPGKVVGVHVPESVPANSADRPEQYRGPDLFTTPGETRLISIDQTADKRLITPDPIN